MAPTTSRDNEKPTAHRTGIIYPSLGAAPYRFKYFSLFDNKKRLDDLRNITGGASPSPTTLYVVFALHKESKHLYNFGDITAGEPPLAARRPYE